MLDGLFGRGISSKCKSSIKLINTRIEVIRRRKNTMLRHLRKDVADLLSNGQDMIAFNRVEELIKEQNLSSGYDMIEQYCGCILDKLSCIQKQREFPGEMREAVASLMFAAARFADLPELRTLRTIFTDQYGDALASSVADPHSNCSSVNQEFVEKVSSKQHSMDAKLQLMQEVSKEFSINWDSKAFEVNISHPHASVCDQPLKRGSFQNRNDNATHQVVCNVRDEVIQTDNREASINRRPEPAHRDARKKKNDSRTPAITGTAEDYPPNAIVKAIGFSREAENLKPNFPQNIMPPPYIKPRNGSKYETNSKVRHEGPNHREEPTGLIVHDGGYVRGSEGTDAGSHHARHGRQAGIGPTSLDGLSGDEKTNPDKCDTNTKPKSVSRRHIKPSVNTSGETNDTKIPRRNSSNRTRGPRPSIHKIDGDDDDAVMDELLLHYSRKPSYDTTKTSMGTRDSPAHQVDDVSGSSLLSSQNRKRDGRPHLRLDMGAPPGRAISLPKEQTRPPVELVKGPNRAASFQHDMLSPNAGHVHPKLPDYDNLAARMAALRKGM